MRHILNLLLVLGGLGVYSLSAGASETQEPPAAELPDPMPKVDCTNIVAQMKSLKKMAGEHNQSVAAFMDDVIVNMDRWYQEFAALEGKSVSVPMGQFNKVRETSEKVGEVQGKVWEDLGIVDHRFDDLLEVLPSCLK